MRPPLGVLSLAVLACTLALGAAPAHAQQTRDNLWVPNGAVSTVAAANGLLYIGGAFDQVGPPTGSFVALDAGTGAALLPYARVVGSVYAIAPDGAGGWYIGGAFTAVQGQPRQNLARIDASGHVTAWAPTTSTDCTIEALAFANNTLYVGGAFSSIGGQPRKYLAALDTTGNVTAWDPEPSNSAGSVNVLALAVNGSNVYVGGAFDQVGGAARANVAALDATTGAATAWNPGPNGRVYAISIRSQFRFPFTVTIYIGGAFTAVGGQQRYQIASVDAGGTLNPWSPNAAGTVRALFAGLSGPIYAAGDFTTIGTYPRNHIAALDSNTGVATAWDPNADYPVHALVVLGSTVIACGNFSSIGGAARSGLAMLDATTGAATAWDPRVGNQVLTLAAGGGTVLVGGQFTTVGGVARHGVAALDPSTGQPTAWAPVLGTAPFYGAVYSLVVRSGRLYAGGNFPSVDGQPRRNLAAFDVVSGGLLGWNPGATSGGTGGYVMAMTASGDTVYVGGLFDTAGGLARPNLAAIDAVTGAATAWNPASAYSVLDRDVTALAVGGNTIYVGGDFVDLGGQPRKDLAALDATTGAATAWNPSPATVGRELHIDAVAADGPVVYLGGAFDQVGGRPRENLAALDAVSGLATMWDPYANSEVGALLLNGGTLYVGGGFDSLGSSPRGGLSALEPAHFSVTPWSPPALQSGSPLYGGFAQTLATDGGTMYVGGSFLGVGGFARSYLAGFSNSVLAVEEHGGAPAAASLRAAPNPFRASVALTIAQPLAGAVDVTVYDIAGRRVRDLHRGALPAGEARLEWDGRDEAGTRVSAGVYLVRAQTDERAMTARVVRVE